MEEITHIERFLDKQKSKGREYVRISIEPFTHISKGFREGKLLTSEYRKGIIGRLEILRGSQIYYGGEILENITPSQLHLYKFLKLLEENLRAVTISVPKEIKYPTTCYRGETKEISIPGSMEEEVRQVTSVKSPFQLYAEYLFEETTRYSYDSNGIEVIDSIPIFQIELGVELTPEEKIARKFGIMPKDEKDIERINRLLPYLPDITLQEMLRGSRSLEELAKNLVNIGKMLQKKRAKISHGLYDVICPYTTFAHEIYGHALEKDVKLLPISYEEKYEPHDLFQMGAQVSSQHFSLVDDPMMEIENLRLIGGFNFDEEMFPAKRKKLVKDGAVVEMLGSKYTEDAGVGNARAADAEAFPIPRMSITHVPPSKDGPNSLEEMVKNNTILTIKNEGSVETENALFVVGKAGNRIERNPETFIYRNGDLIPVYPFHTFTGGIFYTLATTQLSSSRLLVYDPGKCEKSNPISSSDAIFSSQVAPMALLHNIQYLSYRLRRAG